MEAGAELPADSDAVVDAAVEVEGTLVPDVPDEPSEPEAASFFSCVAVFVLDAARLSVR